LDGWELGRRLASTSRVRERFIAVHGESGRQAVLTLYAVAVVFGVVAVAADSLAKLVALVVLTLLMAAAIGGLVWRDWLRRRKIVPK
jgi:hypothetical protein